MTPYLLLPRDSQLIHVRLGSRPNTPEDDKKEEKRVQKLAELKAIRLVYYDRCLT